jgi:hypothetical protein
MSAVPKPPIYIMRDTATPQVCPKEKDVARNLSHELGDVGFHNIHISCNYDITPVYSYCEKITKQCILSLIS